MLNFLLLEDSPLDAEVLLATLNDGGIDCELWLADTRAEFIEALETKRFDLILADYAVPGFDGASALKIARRLCPEMPFIFVSGSLGEELAIESIKQGATDYVLKQRLERLVPCVHRALREADERRARLQAETALKESEAILKAELNATKQLQLISSQLIQEDDVNSLYEQILDATIALMRSDMGSLQMLDMQQNELLLLASRGFAPQSIASWQRVRSDSPCVCGMALNKGERVFVPDIETCDFIADVMTYEAFRLSDIRSVYTTPLLTRTGHIVGMISAHWRKPHQPLERELNLLEVLTRQAADLIEQLQTAAELSQLLEREREARQEAERANRVKDEFLSILSHELRSPLNPILGWSILLQKQKLDSTQMAKGLAAIERNAKVQTQLIDDLLDVARILEKKLRLKPTAVALNSVVVAAIETLKTIAESKSISISLNSDLSSSEKVWGDPVRLQQIVWNLLSNAIKFTPSGGRVDIRLERIEDLAQITVSDTGKGIAPDFLPYIFESFRQQDASTTREFGGLGLGLAIVRYLVEAHDGTIIADSSGEGLGATFTIELPLLQVPLDSNGTRELPPSELDLTGIRILAVDDRADARNLLTAVLTSYGAEVRTVTSANEVLTIIDSFQPYVLIGDLAMPDMDGYTLIEQIRALPSQIGEQIVAIALTAYAREEDRQRALASGYQAYLTKPLNPLRLVQTVADFFN
ncbi:response regulator [Myxosarcina sp. GI1]|uniref:response regulator n=1 Tax=Myxosarcina sp. GI1 TaxID=1541065 RepID=UPI00068A1CDC|nr:response regulator [Myxosarcina sp. GI1]